MTTYTLDEVKNHTSGESCWVTIHNKVYDITEFLDEHPGGEEILFDVAGKDATEQFEDVGHSSDARDLLKDYFIGDLDDKDQSKFTPKEKGPDDSNTDKKDGFSWWLVALSLAVVGASVGYYMMYLNN